MHRGGLRIIFPPKFQKTREWDATCFFSSWIFDHPSDIQFNKASDQYLDFLFARFNCDKYTSNRVVDSGFATIVEKVTSENITRSPRSAENVAVEEEEKLLCNTACIVDDWSTNFQEACHCINTRKYGQRTSEKFIKVVSNEILILFRTCVQVSYLK